MFEDQVEQLKELFQSIKERVQESSIYLTLCERYSSLSPKMQKLTLLSLGVLAAFILVSPPLAKYYASNENLTHFKDRKSITQKIIQQAKASNTEIKTPKQISMRELEEALKDFAKSPVINLTNDQTSVRVHNSEPKATPQAQQDSFKVIGKDFNAEQILNLTYSFKRYNSSLLVTKLTFKESTMKPGYFDNEIDITNMYVAPISEALPTPEADTKPKKRSRNTTRRR